MAVDKKIRYKDRRLTPTEKKKIKPANQGGGKNYLGKQETVTVPKKWLSDPDHVVAELAYITPREQKILLDANIYGSLKGKPNKGPGGVMSLQGDLGGFDASPGGPDDKGGPAGGGGRRDDDKQRVKDILTGNLVVGQTAAKGPRTKQYSNLPEYMRVLDPKTGTYKDRYVGSAYKSYGQPSLFGGLFSRGARGYRGIKGLSAFGTPTFEPTRGPDGTGPLGFYTDDEDFAETRGAVPFGLLGILSAIGDSFNKKFGKKQDMSRFNKLQLVDGELVDDPKNTMILSDAVKNPPMESLALQRFFNNNIITPRAKPTDTGIKSLQPDNILAAPVKDLSGNVIDTGAFNYLDFDAEDLLGGTPTPKKSKPTINKNIIQDDFIDSLPDDVADNLMAELTDKQKRFIDQKKFGLQEGLISPRSVFETITNPDLGVFDTGVFGIGAQEPTTEQEYNDYLRSLGLTAQV